VRALLKTFQSDLPASIFVFLVALPLCLGIALGSEAPLFSGLIAGMVGGVVVGIISKSSLSVSGPAAGLTTIVAAAIHSLPAYEAFLLAVVIAGVLQFIFGQLKAGMLGDFVPSSVIKGMLAAIGLTLILKQLPHLVGHDADFEGDESFVQPNGENTFSQLITAIDYMTPGAIIIGAISLAIMLAWETPVMRRMSWTRWLPGPLMVVLVGVLLNEYFRTFSPLLALRGDQMVAIPVASSPSEFFSFFTMPDFSYLSNTKVWIVAVTLALVASLETLLGIEAVDKLDPKKRVSPPNRELSAQGVGNFVSGMIGGLPITSVVVRSSANVTAGGDSKLSTILHGVFLAVTIALIPDLMNRIPLSALAGVLIFVGYKLAKPSIAIDLYQKGYSQFIPFVVTVVAILRTDLLIGIGIGILVGMYFVMKNNFRSSMVVAREGTNVLIRFRPEVSFLNKALLKKELSKVEAGENIFIDSSRCRFIDPDIREIIDDFVATSASKGIRVDWQKPRHTDPISEPAL
jgi:MFS superfamily sulfate permease-like transporter